MAALAETVANKTQSSPLTDDAINYFSLSGFTFERLAQVLLEDAEIVTKKLSEDELETELATISIRAVMPKNIKNIPVEKIIKVREKYSGQFGRFQEFAHNVIAELPNLKLIEGQQFVSDHLEAEYKKNVKPKLDELDDLMNSIGIETIPTIINMEVKLPSLLVGSGLVAATIAVNPILGATAAVAMGLSKIIGDKRKAIKDEIKKSDVAYLMNIRDDLTPAGSLDWLNIQSRKLLFGV
jgi:hypothetical protein